MLWLLWRTRFWERDGADVEFQRPSHDGEVSKSNLRCELIAFFVVLNDRPMNEDNEMSLQ